MTTGFRFTDMGRSTIHIYTLRGLTSCIEVLLRFGADLDIPDADGNTPLIIAAGSGKHDIVKLLLDHKVC